MADQTQDQLVDVPAGSKSVPVPADNLVDVPAGSKTMPADDNSATLSTGPLHTPGVADAVNRTTAGLTEGAKDTGRAIKSAVVGALEPPTNPMEHYTALTGGPGALLALRAARAVTSTVEKLANASAKEYPQALADYHRALQELQNYDYRNAAASAASLGTDVVGAVDPMLANTANEYRDLANKTRPGGNLAGAVARKVVPTAVALATANPEVAAAGGEIADTLPEAIAARNPFRKVSAASEDFSVNPIKDTSNAEAGTQAVQNVADATTRTAGGTPPAPTSLREVWKAPVDAQEAVAKSYYKILDDASNNEWTANETALKNVRNEMRYKMGLSEDTDNALIARKTRLEWQQQQILDKVPAGTADAAKKAWMQKSRLEDIADVFNKKSNVSGVHPDMVKPGVKLPPEQYNFKGIAKDLNAMTPEDLTTALGSKQAAQELVTSMNLAAKQGWASGKALATVKSLMRTAAVGAGFGAAAHII